MKEEIIDKNLTATIDGYTPEGIEVWQIIKAETFIINNQDLNTTLSNDIEVDATLYYMDDDNERQKMKRGSVLIKITDLSGNVIFDSKVVKIQDGKIKCKFSNNLLLNDYLLTIEYSGTKYYAPKTLTIKFAVERRDVICVFDEILIQGYPNEKKEIGVSLVDKISNKKISNCTIYYNFNGFQYITQTNDKGHATLQITMPSVHSYSCPQRINNINDLIEQNEGDSNVYYFDYNGHIRTLSLSDNNDRTEFTIDGAAAEIEYQNEDIDLNYENIEVFFEDYQLTPTFPLTISIDSNTYKLTTISNIDILNKRYNTVVTHVLTINDTIARIDGRVIANDGNNYYPVEYGKISFGVDEYGAEPYGQTLVDEGGYFDFEVDLSHAENANVSNDLPITSFHKMYDTNIELVILNESLSTDNRTRLSRSYLNRHRMRFMATVTNEETDVQYGMVTFIITEGVDEVYRYVTEVDKNGDAFFNFDVSKVGEFKIKASYHGIFEFNSSQSEIKDYIIINEDEE